MNGTSIVPATGAQRAMKLLIEASAIGELGVGIAVVLFPRTVSGLLLGAPIQGTGAVIARLVGVAVAALGLTWWFRRGDRIARREIQANRTRNPFGESAA